MEIEVNKVYNEDCLITMGKLPDKFVDLIVTSPPYNMRTRIRNGVYTTREKSGSFSVKYSHFSDDLPVEEFYSFHKKVLQEMLRVSKIICYNFQLVTGSKESFLKLLGDYNEQIKDIIIWDKGHGQPAIHDKVLNSCYEFILVLEDDKLKGRSIQNSKFSRGFANNILRIGRGYKTNGNNHNAIFPFELVKQLMIMFSDVNDLVYDPFMGTGTTVKTAKVLNRKFIGSEIVKEYFDEVELSLLDDIVIPVKSKPNVLEINT